MADLLKEIDRSPLPGLTRSLQSYFGDLGWAPWQADPRRVEALALAQGTPNG